MFVSVAEGLTRAHSAPHHVVPIRQDEQGDGLTGFQPGSRDIKICWNGDRQYEPDFIVETAAIKLMVEVKDDSQMTDADVLEKAAAAKEWCSHATGHARSFGGKAWSYLLVPESAIVPTATLDGLIARFAV